ncbi:DUF2917 domain-containing protein [Acidovorax sp. BL-A-41-H1]|uniref:DUF2917 domain-containing protein n=1 Tax=Acidovorax sp. BL-A-41-H1 TaxID=3421102 RepID=UPI003F7963A5
MNTTALPTPFAASPLALRNTAPLPPPGAALPGCSPEPLAAQWKRQPLPPLQAVQSLEFGAGEIALLELEQGRVWVTCDGLLEDYFLEAGQRLSFTGPVRLRVSAEGQRPATLAWARQAAQRRGG